MRARLEASINPEPRHLLDSVCSLLAKSDAVLSSRVKDRGGLGAVPSPLHVLSINTALSCFAFSN